MERKFNPPLPEPSLEWRPSQELLDHLPPAPDVEALSRLTAPTLLFKSQIKLRQRHLRRLATQVRQRLSAPMCAFRSTWRKLGTAQRAVELAEARTQAAKQVGDNPVNIDRAEKRLERCYEALAQASYKHADAVMPVAELLAELKFVEELLEAGKQMEQTTRFLPLVDRRRKS